MIGASGHARSVLEVVHAEGKYHVVGLIDSFQEVGTERFGYKLLGGEVDIPSIFSERQCSGVVIAIGDNYQRGAMYERIVSNIPDLHMPICVHPSAVIASDVVIGEGSVVMPGAVAVSGSSIGRGCILNTQSSLDHDSEMLDWSSLGPGAVTGGRVRIGERSSIGLGANVIQGATVGNDTVVGAGALVLQDIADRVVAYGVPARSIRERIPGEPYL